MSVMTTFAPSRANLAAYSRPIPWAPPVTIAVLPSSFMSITFSRRAWRAEVRFPRCLVVNSKDSACVLAHHFGNYTFRHSGAAQVAERLLRLHGVVSRIMGTPASDVFHDVV